MDLFFSFIIVTATIKIMNFIDEAPFRSSHFWTNVMARVATKGGHWPPPKIYKTVQSWLLF